MTNASRISTPDGEAAGEVPSEPSVDGGSQTTHSSGHYSPKSSHMLCNTTQHAIIFGILLVFDLFLLSKHLQRPFSHPKAFSTTARAWLRR